MYRVHLVYEKQLLALVLPTIMYLGSLCTVFSWLS